MTAPATPPRLVSLDALRGFDMFWILGMETVAFELGKLYPAAAGLCAQLEHVPWAGFHFLDLVFPMFVFISGASQAFSVHASLQRVGPVATARKIILRAAVLYLLGLLYYQGIANGVGSVRWVGVLQRIAICNLAAGLLLCFASGRTRLVITAAILLGYYLLLRFVPPPGGQMGDFAEGPEHNLANWVDFQFLPGRRWDKTHDPEGLLSTFPAIASALLGVMAGEYLRSGVGAGRQASKAGVLVGAGIALAALGWLWGLDFPIIKKLWTSSFVLVAGGYSLVLLGAFYWVIDVAGVSGWAAPFIWIGMNPITLYLMERLMRIEDLIKAAVGGPISAAFGPAEVLWLAVMYTAFNIGVAWWLHRRRIYLKV